MFSLAHMRNQVLFHVPSKFEVFATHRALELSFVAMSCEMSLQVLHSNSANVADFHWGISVTLLSPMCRIVSFHFSKFHLFGAARALLFANSRVQNVHATFPETFCFSRAPFVFLSLSGVRAGSLIFDKCTSIMCC